MVMVGLVTKVADNKNNTDKTSSKSCDVDVDVRTSQLMESQLHARHALPSSLSQAFGK